MFHFSIFSQILGCFFGDVFEIRAFVFWRSMPFRMFLKFVYIQSNIRIYGIGMFPDGFFLCTIPRLVVKSFGQSGYLRTNAMQKYK
jgi:hypothetical protein